MNVIAYGAAFEKKDLLKSRGYSWQANKKIWSKDIYESDRTAEEEWLAEIIYEGKCIAQIHEVQLLDNFKLR